MKVMKRLAVLSIAGAMAFSLTACDGAAGDLLGGALGTDKEVDGALGGDDGEEGGEEGGGSLESLTPDGETYFANAEKGAGSTDRVLVTTVGSGSRMYVVDDGELYPIMDPAGDEFNAQTETLGGKPFAPVYVTGATLQSVRFDHRTKPGECNKYVATKDGDVYNAELTEAAPCSH